MGKWKFVESSNDVSQIGNDSYSKSRYRFVEPEKKEKDNEEDFLTSITAAPFRIAEDINNSAINFANKIPDYYEQSKTEIPGLLNMGNPLIPNPLKRENPFLNKQKNNGHSTMQALAGIFEAINSLANLPKGIAEYGSSRLNLLPQSVPNAIGKITPDASESIQNLFGEPQYPGEAALRGMFRNLPQLIGGKQIASTLNPMKLTYKNIAKDILSTAEKNKSIYTKRYNELWKDADKSGLSKMNSIVPKIDIKTLRKYSPEKNISSIEDFIKDPTLKNAHSAKSDLLRIERDLAKNPTLRGAERKQLKAVKDAIDQIQSNMFKSKDGTINKSLLDKYNSIQKGYSKEVVPYKNKSINKFKRNEISEKELVNALSRGEFAAKRGKFHRQIGIRNNLLPILGIPSVFGLGALAKSFYDGNKNDQNQ
jgi:hypothetical protein